jgi:hypothetical protein
MEYCGLRYEVYARGGSGRSAKWDWEVWGDEPSDENQAEGSVTGALNKAHQAAKAAIDDILMRRRKI